MSVAAVLPPASLFDVGLAPPPGLSSQEQIPPPPGLCSPPGLSRCRQDDEKLPRIGLRGRCPQQREAALFHGELPMPVKVAVPKPHRFHDPAPSVLTLQGATVRDASHRSPTNAQNSGRRCSIGQQQMVSPTFPPVPYDSMAARSFDLDAAVAERMQRQWLLFQWQQQQQLQHMWKASAAPLEAGGRGRPCAVPFDCPTGMAPTHRPMTSVFTPPPSVQMLPSEVLAAACDSDRHVRLLQVLEEGTAQEQRKLVERLTGSILSLSWDKHGCRVVQKAIEVAPSDLQQAAVLELKGHVVECTCHMHGNFVLQKVIEELPQASLDFIIQEVEEEVASLATHIYGCRTVQRLLEHCNSKQLLGVTQNLLRHVVPLSRDSYGNNVLRHLLENGTAENKRCIIQAMSSADIKELGSHKSSSLVLEKCLVAATHGVDAHVLEKERAALVRAVLGRGEGRAVSQPLEAIMLSPYGNYLVQRVIECSQGQEREELRQRLRAAEPTLRTSNTGKHILASMRREFGKQQSTGRSSKQQRA